MMSGEGLPKLYECVFLLLNLQGLNFIFYRIEDLFIGPWFFTNIMCCYILLLCWLRVRSTHSKAQNLFAWGGVLPLMIFVTLAFAGVSTDGALAFFVGLNLKERGLVESPRRRDLAVAVVAALAAVAIRLISRRLIDGTVAYAEVVAPLTHVIFAAAILLGIKWLYVWQRAFAHIAQSGAVGFLDKISVYVYVCHDFFIVGPLLNVFALPVSLALQLLLFLAFTILTASYTYMVGSWLTRRIERAIGWLFGWEPSA